MKSKLIARLRWLFYSPKHRKRKRRPEPERVTPEQFRLMFSGQMMHRRYYREKNGVRREYIVW